MFCPKCGSMQSDELKFCKSCGANLSAVRKAVESKDSGDKFDWNKTWLAEMMLSGEEAARRAAVIQGLTPPEVKRRNEIKAGVITASVGLGLMILLFVLMNGIIASGRVSDAAAEILSRVWVAGIIPLFVGAALVFNGIFVTKVPNELESHKTDPGAKDLDTSSANEYLPPVETRRIDSGVPFSVTDETTRHLEETPVPRARSASNEDR